MARILLATDGSPSARRATDEALTLARATGWPLTIVTVWHLPATGFDYGPTAIAADLGDALREQAQQALDVAAAGARAAGVEVETELLGGIPSDEICELAARRGATVVVVGAHGWGPVRRLLFGSVSQAVLHHAPCPVLVVRGDPEPD